MTDKQYLRALGYAKRIRNPAKRAYALAYLEYLEMSRTTPCPEPQCSVMAAQAVRMQFDEIVQ